MPLNYQMKSGQKRRNAGAGGERRTNLVFWTNRGGFVQWPNTCFRSCSVSMSKTVIWKNLEELFYDLQ